MHPPVMSESNQKPVGFLTEVLASEGGLTIVFVFPAVAAFFLLCAIR